MGFQVSWTPGYSLTQNKTEEAALADSCLIRQLMAVDYQLMTVDHQPPAADTAKRASNSLHTQKPSLPIHL